MGRLAICGALATENVPELQNLNLTLRQMIRGLVLQPSLSLPFPSLMKKEEEKNDGMCLVVKSFAFITLFYLVSMCFILFLIRELSIFHIE